MDEKDKLTKTEKILLGLTAAFLCVLLALYGSSRDQTVTVDHQVPQEEIVPPLVPVDLNAAGEAELAELPGIGPELARRIVEYREEHGPFAKPEELMEVSGIGEGKFAALDGRITVE